MCFRTALSGAARVLTNCAQECEWCKMQTGRVAKGPKLAYDLPRQAAALFGTQESVNHKAVVSRGEAHGVQWDVDGDYHTYRLARERAAGRLEDDE